MLNYVPEEPTYSEETMRRIIDALADLRWETGCVYRTIYRDRTWELQEAKAIDLENNWEYGTIFSGKTLEELLAYTHERLAAYDKSFTQGAE